MYSPLFNQVNQTSPRANEEFVYTFMLNMKYISWSTPSPGRPHSRVKAPTYVLLICKNGVICLLLSSLVAGNQNVVLGRKEKVADNGTLSLIAAARGLSIQVTIAAADVPENMEQI